MISPCAAQAAPPPPHHPSSCPALMDWVFVAAYFGIVSAAGAAIV